MLPAAVPVLAVVTVVHCNVPNPRRPYRSNPHPKQQQSPQTRPSELFEASCDLSANNEKR